MKIVIAQILIVFCILRKTYCLDDSYYQSHALNHQEHKKPIIPILKYIAEQSNKGWKYSYETGNGIHAEQYGYIKNHGDEKHESVVQQGSVTYHDEHGHPITLTYIADEHGFQPKGEHLPTPPPVPEDIQKALEEQGEGQIEIGEGQEEYDDKEGYDQAQSYAESQLQSKIQAYEQGPAQRYGVQGYGPQNYRRPYQQRQQYSSS